MMMPSSGQAPVPPSVSPKSFDGTSINDLANSKAQSKFSKYEIECQAAYSAGFADWCEANPQAVRWIEDKFLEYAARGRHFSFGLIWELARDAGVSKNGRYLWKMPNAYRRPMHLYLADRFPQAAKLTTLRRSR